MELHQAKHFHEEEEEVTVPGPGDIAPHVAVLSQHDVVTFSPALQQLCN